MEKKIKFVEREIIARFIECVSMTGMISCYLNSWNH